MQLQHVEVEDLLLCGINILKTVLLSFQADVYVRMEAVRAANTFVFREYVNSITKLTCFHVNTQMV